VHALAVDWSGARSVAAQRRGIWVASALDGVLCSLDGGWTRGEVVEEIIHRAEPGLVVGLDFSFSFPGWFVRDVGAADGPGVWEVAAAHGEDWLARCAPPFWGRPGCRRPPLEHERPLWRRTEAGAGLARRRPKSTFQVGGAGAVGCGAIRGMPHLQRLRRHGLAVWPFDAPVGGRPLVAEVYPRWATGPVVKAREEERLAHVSRLGPAIPRRLAALAAASDDAFDAACAAVVLSTGGLAFPPTDDVDAVEGRILPLGVT
jgi:hypothetical protein